MRKFLLYSSALVLGLSGAAQSACIQTPTCSSLGYTSSSSCTGGVKCPFGNAWNCTAADFSDKITELTNKITEQTNKITEIETKVEEVEVIVTRPNSSLRFCGVGNIFYSDWTCSIELDSSKTPIGVVVYDDGFGHGQVMALKSIGSYTWGVYGTDVPTLSNYTSASVAQNDIGSCANSAKIMAAGNKSTYTAVWAANEYSTEGTSAGDWCLPAAGIFTSYKNNQDAINSGFTKAGGTQFTISTYAWSSSEYDERYTWLSNLNGSYGLYYNGNTNSKGRSYEVRPVLAF